MKKLLLLSASALLSLSAMAQVTVPTLTQDWTVVQNLPVSTAARWAAGYNGKIYIQNNADAKVTVLDGATITDIATGVNGWCLTVDEAGNLIISGGKYGTGSVAYSILPAGKTASSDLVSLTVTPPADCAQGRMDTFGRAIGNVMSVDGGAFYTLAQNQILISKIFVANGAQVADKSVAINPGKEFAASTNSNLSVVQPINSDVNATDNVVWMSRSTQNSFCKLDGTSYAEYSYQPDKSVNSTAGGDIITLGGVVYTIEPAGTSASNGFVIVDRTNDEVVYTFNETGVVSGGIYSVYVGFEKVSDTKANVYHYAPGINATKYTFEVPEVSTAIESVAVDANAPVEYYNLQGVKVANPENGLFIKKQGNKATKVIL